MPERRSVIVGSKYQNGAIEALPDLKKGDLITLKAEPDNSKDTSAVACYSSSDQHLGYIPRTHNVELSRLLRGGRIVHARIDEVAVLVPRDGKPEVKDPPRVEIWW